MKRYIMTAILAGLVSVAFAQTKPRLDHGYSTHNYKHANKAAVARQIQNAESGVSIQRDGSVRENIGLQSTANYKVQRPYNTNGKLNIPAPPVTGYATNDPSQSPRNYKMGRSSIVNPNDQLSRSKKDTNEINVGNE